MFTLNKSATKLQQAITRRVTGSLVSSAMINKIEEALIEADLGYNCAKNITEKLVAQRYKNPESIDELQEHLRILITQKLKACENNKLKTVQHAIDKEILVVVLLGTNGAGKTSSVGKIAAQFKNVGAKIIIAACDTFRAAATEQLNAWAKLTKSEIITAENTTDPAAIAFRALDQTREKNANILIIDTAGRLDSDANLMQQIPKIERALNKQKNTYNEKYNAKNKIINIEFWLVLDATLGQNIKIQAKRFAKQVTISGFIITKLDSSAKAGAIIEVVQETKTPINFIVYGENIDDIATFNAKYFAEELVQITKT